MTNKLQEVYAFVHNGITVLVKIDYSRNIISLVEPTYEDYKGKLYLFSGRKAKYLDNWLNILEAMQEAVKDAKKRYEQSLIKQEI